MNLLASTFSGVNDFFNSGTWLVIRNLLFFFAAVIWFASLYWIYKDAKRRILVSRETKELCGEAFDFVPAGSYKVKGRAQQVELYEPGRK